MCSRVHLLWVLCGLLAGSDRLVAAPLLQRRLYSELSVSTSCAPASTKHDCILLRFTPASLS